MAITGAGPPRHIMVALGGGPDSHVGRRVVERPLPGPRFQRIVRYGLGTSAGPKQVAPQFHDTVR